MSDILKKIEDYKRDEIAAAKAQNPLAEIKARAAEQMAQSPIRDFEAALATKCEQGVPALIAEIKKASPSKGLIRADFDPALLAQSYQQGGACCLSVLTDTPSFQGAPEYLTAARAATHLPVLRKDFMFDPYQVYEARSWGADCILIIMAAVSLDEAKALEDAAHECGMSVLIETHEKHEVEHVQTHLTSRIIGINNRNLNSFITDLNVTYELISEINNDKLIISESGINSVEDIKSLSDAGAHGFLVGESLMRQENLAEATRALLQI